MDNAEGFWDAVFIKAVELQSVPQAAKTADAAVAEWKKRWDCDDNNDYPELK